MAYTNHNIISDYFKKRPQLKKPKMNQLGFDIPPEWKDFVESLIQRVEKSEQLRWVDSKEPIHTRDNDPYYGGRYSVAVIVKNQHTGSIWQQFVRWDFLEDGWVEANMCEGDSPGDYEMIHVTHWMLIQ